ncbi:hypothetical protein GWI33_001762 [Rhynchophorus ferrugineus]|uniref:Uncharacterized protein n=1 Tax=Rhynchophorus ferrugineus TaxID=354439 RepID=A0A834IQ85_RHYFE|nr:hypothetical protein GWI33_001762 [Rhynchophorus ferrugineus]
MKVDGKRHIVIHTENSKCFIPGAELVLSSNFKDSAFFYPAKKSERLPVDGIVLVFQCKLKAEGDASLREKTNAAVTPGSVEINPSSTFDVEKFHATNHLTPFWPVSASKDYRRQLITTTMGGRQRPHDVGVPTLVRPSVHPDRKNNYRTNYGRANIKSRNQSCTDLDNAIRSLVFIQLSITHCRLFRGACKLGVLELVSLIP